MKIEVSKYTRLKLFYKQKVEGLNYRDDEISY